MRHSRTSRALTLTALPALALASAILGLPATAAGATVTPNGTAAPAETAAAGGASLASGPGTIVYIKNHNVYVARPDGTGERRLTSNGTAASPWVTPSGADNGTIAAARGSVVYRMDQWGTILNSFDPPNITSSADELIGGRIAHSVISPDGSKIAYTYAYYSCGTLPSHPCRTRWVTAVSAATHLTSYRNYGKSYTTNPSWMTNSRMVLQDYDQAITVFELATSNGTWYSDYQPNASSQENLYEPTVSRDGRLFASVRGEGAGRHIGISAIGGNVLTGPAPTPNDQALYPQLFCATHDAPGFASPTFAPDSSGLAWEDPAGVWVLPNPEDCADQEVLAIAGAKSPHWAKPGLQTSRPSYRLSAKAAPKISGKARVGKRLKASAGSWNYAPTKVGYRWLRNGKSIKGASKSSYKLTRKDRGKRISVRVTVSRSGAFKSAVATSKRIKVRR